MFLILGYGQLALRLAKWCGSRRRCVLVGLADRLPLDGPLEQCDVIALPFATSLSELPLGDRTPTAVLLLDSSGLSDEDPLEVIQTTWPRTPVLTTMELEGDGLDLVSIDDVSMSAIQDRIRSWERKDGAHVIKSYLESVPEGSKVAIFCHDNPDPDALAAGLAMHELASSYSLDCEIYYGGLIEHQQNQAMARLLEIPCRRLILEWEIDDVLKQADVVITVDFHKPGANNILPHDCVPHIVIDHHTMDEMVAADISMVRPEFSATSSLLASILMSLNHPMNARIATALAFGIRSDTLGFTRNFNSVDIRALSWLNAWVDSDLLSSLTTPPRSQETLESFSEALSSKIQVGNCLLAPLNHMPNRDALAQIADFLLPTEGVESVVVFGPRRGKVILSARTRDYGIHL